MNKYCVFSPAQISEEKKKIHSAVHWCLIYKEQGYKDLDKYMDGLLGRIGGMNKLFGCPCEIITLMSLIQAAKDENLKDNCDFAYYRKLILDAHSMIDKIKEG